MKRIANYLLTATALLGAAALLTFAAKNDFGLARNMETLVNMMRELSVYYVDEVDADRLMTDAAEGMVRRLDPYTVYMPEEEMTDFQFLTTGKYGGVGALITRRATAWSSHSPTRASRPTAPDCRSATASSRSRARTPAA